MPGKSPGNPGEGLLAESRGNVSKQTGSWGEKGKTLQEKRTRKAADLV